MKFRIALVVLTAAGLSTAVFASGGPGRDGAAHMQMFPFDQIDTDKDGAVTKAELEAFRASEAATLDANSDGKISADELSAAHLARMAKRADDMAARMIERLDTDGDKALSAAELAARPMPVMLFEKADADGDGAVTKAEAEALREKMAERMADHGGKGKHGRPRGWDFMGDN